MKSPSQFSLTALFYCSLARAHIATQSIGLTPTCSPHSIFDAIPVSGFEPSDAAWDADSQLLYIIDDNGRLAAIPGHHVRSRYIDRLRKDNNQMMMGAANHGQDVKVWTVTEDVDIEGCAVDHDFPDLVYLGVEAPAEILAFNVTAGEIQHRFPVGDYFATSKSSFSVNGRSLKKHKGKHDKNPALNAGLESLAFYPSTKPGGPSRLIAGRQSDSMIFVFDLAADRQGISYVGSVKPPGPGHDLSSMSVFLGKVYLVFDKALEVVSVPMKQFEAAIKPAAETLPQSPGAAVLEMRAERRDRKSHRDQTDRAKRRASTKGSRKAKGKARGKGKGAANGKKKWTVERFKFDARGHEGIAFAYSSFSCALSSRGCSEAADTPVVYAIDPPKKPGYTKDVTVGSFDQFQECWRV